MGIREKTMKIEWLEFINLETGLSIEHIDFFDDVTLLVGLSGAGKTQILDAINYSLNLALGKTNILYPYNASIGFKINNHHYIWSYIILKQAQTDIDEFDFDNSNKYYFSYEKLSCEENIIFIRDQDHIEINTFNNIPTPKKDESLIYQYAEDSNFEETVQGLKKLYPIDIEIAIRGGFDSDRFDSLKSNINLFFKKNSNVGNNIFSHLPTLAKIYITKNYYHEQFEKILNSVQEIFPEIQDINIIKDFTRDCYFVEIKVYNKKLQQKDISNGMLKTIYYIVELYTASTDSLIIIDEFENGLGMNCIDSISDLMLYERTDLQYIITSHHPKIIGNIDYHSWKIIERDKRIVRNFVCDDPEYDLGGNKHDAYYNLLQKWDFEGKI